VYITFLAHLEVRERREQRKEVQRIMESTTKIDLFGGAITAMCPTGFFSDISNFRQVPDNQEVFVSTKPPNIAVSKYSQVIKNFKNLMATIYSSLL
jgi:hypothetical protein